MRSTSATKGFYSLCSAILIASTVGPCWPQETAAPQKEAPSEAKAEARKTESKPVSPTTANPEAQALINRAYSDMRAGNWGFAIAELCSALRYDRANPMARRYLCYCLLQSGNSRDALTQLDALSQLNQTVPFDQCMRGEALAMMGEPEKALDVLKSALSSDPSSDYIRTKLIDTLQSLARYQEAANYCSEGYFSAKSTQMKSRYLGLFNTMQQQRALIAQKTMGIQIAVTGPVPPPAAPSRRAASSKAKGKSAAAAESESDNDDSEAPVLQVPLPNPYNNVIK